MRLTPHEVAAIKVAAAEAFGPSAVVRLFGSRVDDSRRGGDIDLHVEVAGPIPSIQVLAGFRRSLNLRVGERDYDIIVASAEQRASPVDRRALAEGVVL